MRRSFGGGSSGSRSGMGGGSGGGSIQMLRSVQRAVRSSSSQEPFSHSNPTTTTTSPAKNSTSASRRARQTTSAITGGGNKSNGFTLSSSSASSLLNSNFPISASSAAWPSSPTFSDESSDWVCVDGLEDDRAQVLYDDFVFGSVPSQDEVHHAVIALHEVLDPGSPTYLAKDSSACKFNADADGQVTSPTGSMRIASPFGPKLDWMEPPYQLWSSNMSQCRGFEKVHDAFNLLRNEPSVQRMVMSLASDRAVWDAVLNNEVVQELRETFNPDTCPSEKSEDGDDDNFDVAKNFLNWILNTKAKVMEFTEKITKLVNAFFHVEEDAKTADRRADPFEEKLRASFFLSVVVMLIVVVARMNA